DIYYPTITSYDYDSLLTEGGAITEKYKAVKKVLREYREVPADFEETATAKAHGEVTLSEAVSLFDVLEDVSEKVEHSVPLAMEDIDQAYGYTLYRTTANRQGEWKGNAGSIRDRGCIDI